MHEKRHEEEGASSKKTKMKQTCHKTQGLTSSCTTVKSVLQRNQAPSA